MEENNQQHNFELIIDNVVKKANGELNVKFNAFGNPDKFQNFVDYRVSMSFFSEEAITVRGKMGDCVPVNPGKNLNKDWKGTTYGEKIEMSKWSINIFSESAVKSFLIFIAELDNLDNEKLLWSYENISYFRLDTIQKFMCPCVIQNIENEEDDRIPIYEKIYGLFNSSDFINWFENQYPDLFRLAWNKKDKVDVIDSLLKKMFLGNADISKTELTFTELESFKNMCYDFKHKIENGFNEKEEEKYIEEYADDGINF